MSLAARGADGAHGIPVGHFLRVVREDSSQPGLLYAGTEYGMYISFDEGAHWQRFQSNLPAVPIMDLKVYRRNLIVATEGRAFWVFDDLPVIEQLKAGLDTEAGVLFKPVDAYRQGGSLPTFYYWLKDQPTSPVTVEVMDATGASVFSGTGQPGAGVTPPPSPVPVAGGEGRGGRGGGGRGGFGGGAPVVSAHQGINRTTWSARLASLFTVPAGIVMWGGGGGRGGGGQGPKAAPGVYTVKVSAGAWSQTQTFRLGTDPRLPVMTEADGVEQLKMARGTGLQIKQLYDSLAQIRDVKKQAMEIAQKADARVRMEAAAKALTEKLVAIEGEITELQGEGGQDALNFPGRIDNQWIALYGNVAGAERKVNKSVKERYADLKPPTDQLMQRSAASLKNDVAAFNEAARRAGVKQGIVVK